MMEFGALWLGISMVRVQYHSSLISGEVEDTGTL
jgi:hypothetical protein